MDLSELKSQVKQYKAVLRKVKQYRKDWTTAKELIINTLNTIIKETGLDVEVEFRLARSLRRGAENQALDNKVPDSTVNLVNRWGRYERNRGAEPGFNMLEHYAASTNTRYKQISFSTIL